MCAKRMVVGVDHAPKRSSDPFRLWYARWRAQPEITQDAPTLVKRAATGLLAQQRKRFGLTPDQQRGLIKWWWDYKVPRFRTLGEPGPFDIVPRGLSSAKVVEEWRQWQEVCPSDKRVFHNQQPETLPQTAWTPPAHWATD